MESVRIFLSRTGGEPESRIPLKKLGHFYSRGILYVMIGSDEDADCSIWIYRKRDRILFFTKKKLISHFKWSGFEEQRQRARQVAHRAGKRNTTSFISSPLALVA
jgi:hypothetical protein